MIQFLPRGYRVSDENRIKKMVAYGCDWQIYLTNLDVYVLAVKTSLYNAWASDYSLPVSIFQDDASNDYKVFVSSSNYIISSMEHGPYPENNGQIEAFSIAFKTANDLYPGANVRDAIYIEEYFCCFQHHLMNLVDNGINGKWHRWHQYFH